jgi:hypothetical protein
MKINKHVDLGAAFERLKLTLQKAEAYKERTDLQSNLAYAGAYGMLSQSVTNFIFLNTEGESLDDIRGTNDDLKDIQVFNNLPDIDKEIEKELLT